MSSILLRVLAKKSKFNFGSYKNCTVEDFIAMRKQIELVAMYYKLSTISFNEEILNELGIIGDWRIEKPNTDYNKYFEFITLFFEPRIKPRKELLKMIKQPKVLTKGQLQYLNMSR